MPKHQKIIALEEEMDVLDQWNEEDSEELERPKSIDAYDVLISGRDWTVETIVQQIKQGNIDLDPAFQRRNAWRDQRRSRLVESFILGFPVPQIVLAENPGRKKSFVVIDGKQRLMTIAGFFLPEYRDYWTSPRFWGLSILKDLNGVDIDTFIQSGSYANARRQLSNADIRTTVLSGFLDESVLYDIFYRINTGSVPLSSQELRQALNRGGFSRYLLDVTSEPNPLWKALRISIPDPRLRDVELLLRLIAWRTKPKNYVGNMKPFLDDTMKSLNASWHTDQRKVKRLVDELFLGISAAVEVFGVDVGRKLKNGKFEAALNRALFEVQAYYFSFPSIRSEAIKRKRQTLAAFKFLAANAEFLQSIESTTKSIENYRTRFEAYSAMLKDVLNIDPPALNLGQTKKKA